MNASITLVGIRLAGPVVRCTDGSSVTIPWQVVAGPAARLRTTEAARLLHPGVPERLVGLRGVGSVTIDGLRTRALSRALRDGTYERVWRVLPVRDRALLISMILFVALLGIGAQFGLGRWLMEDDPSGWTPILNIERNSRLLAGIALAIATVGPLLVVTLGRFGRRPKALALKTSASGITWHLDDGRELTQPWPDAPVPQVREVIWPKPPKGVRFSGAVDGKHDFEILRLVMRGRAAGKKSGSLERRARIAVRAILWMSVIFGVLLGLHLLLRVVLPNPVETPYTRPPPMPQAAMLAAAGWILYVAYFGGRVARSFGWRAVRRALVPRKRRRGRPLLESWAEPG
ncbi:MAG: hypothetical protein AMXMBFR47_02250 [Planctomycetota bacterium]